MSQHVLCIIHDLEAYDRWRQSGVPRDGRIVLTWNSQVFRECTVAGIDCLDAIEVVGPEVMDQVYETVIQAAENWWYPQLDGLMHRGVNLAVTMGRDMLYAFLDGLASWECTKRALDIVRPRAMEVVDCGRRAFFWDPPGGPFPGIANGVALWEGGHRGVPSSLICEQPAWTSPPHRRNDPPGPVPEFAGEAGPSLLFFLSNSDHARLQPLLSPIFTGPTRTFLARSGDYEAPEAESAHLAWYDWLSHFPPDPALCREIAIRIDSLKTAQTEFQAHYPVLFGNPFIAFQWDAFAHQLELGGRIVDASNHLLNALKPDVCVLGTATAGAWRTITATSRQHGIPVAAVHHSAILPEWVLCGIWHHDADQLFIEGRLTREMYERWGWSPQSLVETGYPLVKKERQRVGQGGPILVVPNEWDWGFAIPAFVNRKKVESLQDMAEMMNRMPDQSFVLKPHPKCLRRHLEEYHLAAETAANLQVADPFSSITDHMKTASAVVLLDACSQSFLDACLSGTPTIHHRPAILDAQCNLSLQDLGYVPITRTVQELETTLNALRTDDAYRKEVSAGGNKFIMDFSSFDEIDGVRARIFDSLNMLAKSRKVETCCS